MLPTYNIPYRLTDSDELKWNEAVESAVCGDYIWISHTQCGRFVERVLSELILINTVTLETTNVDCDLINYFGYRISEIVCHADKLYVLVVEVNEDEDEDEDDGEDEIDEERTYQLYTIDTKSMDFTKVFEFRTYMILSLLVKGNTFYILDCAHAAKQLYLLKIELLDEIVISKHLLNVRADFGYQKMIKFDDKLCLITTSFFRKPIGHVITDDHHPQCVPFEDHESDSIFEKFNLCLYKHISDSRMLEHLPAYNFNRKPFDRHLMGKCMKFGYDLRCIEFIGDTMYLVYRNNNYGVSEFPVDYFVKVFPLKPKLVDTCLIQLADGSNKDDDNEVKNVLEIMPFGLREKLKNLIGNTQIIEQENNIPKD